MSYQNPLSTDIFLLIIDYLLPPHPPQQIPLLPASHATTKDLVSLTRVSRTTYPIALRFLYKYCLDIDSLWRLDRLSASFTFLGSKGRALPSNESCITDARRIIINSQDVRPERRHGGRVLDRLFGVLGPGLRVLVVDIEMEGVDGELMRKAFGKLTGLKVFCNLCKPKRLPPLPQWRAWEEEEGTIPAWAACKALETLVLYRVQVTSKIGLWRPMRELSALRKLVLVNVDLDRMVKGAGLDVQGMWGEVWDESQLVQHTSSGTEEFENAWDMVRPPLELALVNYHDDRYDDDRYLPVPLEPRESEKMVVSVLKIPVSWESDPRWDPCKNWMLKKFKEGKPAEVWSKDMCQSKER